MLNHLAHLILAGGVMEVLWLLTYRITPLRSHSGMFVTLMLAAFCLCVWVFFRCPIARGRNLTIMLGFALLFRISVLPASPDQSEDVYRYLWDGRLATLGIDPYRYPPEAPELVPYRDAVIYPMINSKPYITAYPPFSQLVFRSSYALFGPAVVPMKAIFCLFEFSALIVAWRLLVSLQAPLQPLLLMAWNPFFIFEFAHSGHSDSAMMLFILLAVYMAHRGQKFRAMAGLAGAILAKLHPALLLPLFARRMGWKAAAAGMSVVAAGVLLVLAPGRWIAYLQSLRLYLQLFEFNAGIHYLLRYVGKTFYDQAWDKITGPYLAILLIVIAALIIRRFPVRDARDLLHAGFWIMTADLCLATTVHPWYLSWAALALPLLPYAFMFYWTGIVFLSYLAYAHRPVYEPSWVLLAEYLPMYALMVWEIARRTPLLQVNGMGMMAVRPLLRRDDSGCQPVME
jgi:alpha-1,6-mannosyltransferase